MDEKEKTCCICGKTYSGFGNNPYPVKNEGRCCDECNLVHVIPARLCAFKIDDYIIDTEEDNNLL